MTKKERVTLLEPTAMNLADWGNDLLLTCATAAGKELTLHMHFKRASAFLLALIRLTSEADTMRSERRLQLGQDPDPEPSENWPMEGVQIRSLPSSQSVGVLFHLRKGATLPMTLTIQQSRQLAASLLRYADELDPAPPSAPH